MAKIDVSKIEGYEEMSAEEKLEALEALDLPEPDYSGYVKKDVFDKTASELAAKKKELRNKMSEDEAKKQEDQEEREKLQKAYNELLHETTVSKNKAKFLALGYDEELAEDTAKALVDGNTEKVFKNQKKYLESFEKKIKADALRETPTPTGGDGEEKHYTREEFRKLNPAERLKFAEEHPDEYKIIYGGTE